MRKTCTSKLQPTAEQEREQEQEQERALGRVVLVCRRLYNTALQQRITAWQRCQVAVSRCEQDAELKAIRAELLEYAALHRHVLHDVLARLDTASQASLRRVQRGEQAGVPRCKGRERVHSVTSKESGTE